MSNNTSTNNYESASNPAQNSSGNYEGYDHSSSEGGYGANSSGDSYSRANQMGGEDKQAASHYGGGQAEVDPVSGDSRASSAWGSGTNSPKQETAKQFEGSSDLNTESTKQDFGRDSSDEVGA